MRRHNIIAYDYQLFLLFTTRAVRYSAAFATFSDTVAGMHTNKVVLELCIAVAQSSVVVIK